jgi:hypothetical protein
MSESGSSMCQATQRATIRCATAGTRRYVHAASVADVQGTNRTGLVLVTGSMFLTMNLSEGFAFLAASAPSGPSWHLCPAAPPVAAANLPVVWSARTRADADSDLATCSLISCIAFRRLVEPWSAVCVLHQDASNGSIESERTQKQYADSGSMPS